MPRLVTIADAKKRDAQIQLESPKRGDPVRWVSKENGAPVHLERLIKTTDRCSLEALLAQHEGSAEALARALVEGDPEVELEQVGRRLGHATRVHVGPGGQVLYAARVLAVVTAPDGTEKSRGDFVDVEASVGEELPPIVWTGRLMPASEVVRRFVFVRKVQLRHVNGLTFDFLYEMAKSLHDERKMLLVGAGAKGQQPLIFQSNGSPFRGFLEGRVEADAYRLVLHLSNLELKRVAVARAAETDTAVGGGS